MRKMKDSGIKWIGEIPEEWEIRKVKHFYHLQTGFTPDTKKQEYYDDSEGYDWVNIADIQDGKTITRTKRKISQQYIDEFNPPIIPKDSLLFSFKLSVGQTAFAGKPMYSNEAIAAFLPKAGINLRFLRYSSFLIMENAELNIYNARILNRDRINNATIVYPTLEEQQRIADYLDAECANIDAVIEQTRASIEEYKKLKQAVITQAVTKGIRHNRTMKDSGIDWIEQIPEEWAVLRGKWLFHETDERSEDGNEELLTVSHITGITPRSQKNVNMFMAESLVGYKICRVNDIAANTMWMWQGAIGVSKYYGVISPSYNTYRQTSNQFNPVYLDYLFRIKPLIDTYNANSTGITASRLRLYPDQFLSIVFPIPPMEEQIEIVSYLNEKVGDVKKLIEKKEQYLSELENYKRSMIFEYVSGKKEV